MTATEWTRGAAPCAASRGHASPLGYQTVPALRGIQACPPSGTTRRLPSSWRRHAARTVPPDNPGLVSPSVIRRFLGVWRFETPVTLFLPNSVASAVEPEDPAVRKLIRDVRTRVIAGCAPSHPDRAVLVDVPRRRSRPAWFPHERRYHSRQHASVEPFANPLCCGVSIHAAFLPFK